MDFLGTVAQLLGAAVNGVLQVITDFINLIIDVLPNPDPFPAMIEQLPTETAVDMGFVWYWLDALVGVETTTGILMAWAALMIGAAVFAVVYWVVKAIKP